MPIKTDYIKHATTFLQRLSDVRFAGQVIFVVVVLLISWSGIKSIQTNYGLQKQIAALEQENKLQELRNQNLALQNEYFNSNQYLELAARQSFGLAAPGEKEIVVPKTVALAYTIDLPKPKAETEKEQSGLKRNVQSWTDFFLHRQGN